MEDNNNLQQINSFITGMNLDTGDQFLPDTSYREAYNLRLTTGLGSNTGTLHNIEGVKFYQNIESILPLTANGDEYTDIEIVHTDTIRRYGIIFVKAKDLGIDYYFIFRFINKEELQLGENGNPKLIFGPCNTYLSHNLSTVTKYEDSDNIKVYYADGVNPLRSINISPAVDGARPMTDDGSFTIYPTALMSKPEFVAFGSGNLKVGAYQYGYQLFNKNGAETEISPLTEVIYTYPGSLAPVGQSQVKGGKKGEISSKSIQLRIPLNDSKYDRIKIISVFYEDTTSVPLIQIIKDARIDSNDNIIQYSDMGNVGIQTLTVEEFNLVSSIHFAPKILETKNNILFASNIQYQDNVFDVDYDARAYGCGITSTNELMATFKNSDNDDIELIKLSEILDGTIVIEEDKDCLNPFSIVNNNASSYSTKSSSSSFNYNNWRCAFTKDVNTDKFIWGGDGVNISYRFIVSELDEASLGNVQFEGVWYSNVTSDGEPLNPRFHRLTNTIKNMPGNYSNYLVASKMKSLRRDELYRYGIVCYNKFNQASPVKWIADIRTPSVYDSGFESFRVNTYVSNVADKQGLKVTQLAVRPLGIEFIVKNLPDDVESYEIVRCKRDIGDRATVTQGIIGNTYLPRRKDSTKDNSIWPHQFMTTASGCFSTTFSNQTNYNNASSSTVIEDTSLAMMADIDQTNKVGELLFKPMITSVSNFTSPEVCYTYESIKDALPETGLKSQMIKYVYPHERQLSDIYFLIGNNEGKLVNYKYQAYSNSGGQVEHQLRLPFYHVLPNQEMRIPLYQQSNYCQSVSPQVNQYGSYCSSGMDNTITDIEFPKEASWKDYESRADFISGINGKVYNNWVGCFFTNDSSIHGIQGPKGRNIVLHNGNPIKYAAGLPAITIASTIEQKSQTTVNVMQKVEYTDTVTNYYNNSVNGTALCNLRKDVVPYGGYGYNDRQFNTYISVGGFNVDGDRDTVLFAGDTYINNFTYVNVHYVSGYPTDNLWESKNTNPYVQYSVPVESDINLSMTNGYGAKSKYAQLQPANINGLLIQDTPMYVYNSVYSVEPTARLFTPQSLYDEYNKHVDVRTHYSLSKLNDAFVDQWTKFKPLNYIDVDTRYGAITNLRTFGNELLYWQENAVGKFSVNERTLITDDSNAPLMLGIGGVLSRYDYLATTNGMHMGTNDSDCQSDHILYFYDYTKHELCQYVNGQIQCISKSKFVQSYLNNLDLDTDKLDSPILTFDKYYNEVIATLSKRESLVYSENSQIFTSFYTLVPDYNLYFNSNVYFVHDNKLYQYNADTVNAGFNEESLPIQLNYIVNKDYMRTKVFDNIEFTGYLNKGAIRFTFMADEAESKILSGSGISDREHNYRAAVPRQNTKELFGNRLRSRVLQCKLEYNLTNTEGIGLVTIKDDEYLQTIQKSEYLITNNVDGSTTEGSRFELPYIRTTYRISRS